MRGKSSELAIPSSDISLSMSSASLGRAAYAFMASKYGRVDAEHLQELLAEPAAVPLARLRGVLAFPFAHLGVPQHRLHQHLVAVEAVVEHPRRRVHTGLVAQRVNHGGDPHRVPLRARRRQRPGGHPPAVRV